MTASTYWVLIGGESQFLIFSIHLLNTHHSLETVGLLSMFIDEKTETGEIEVTQDHPVSQG